MKTFLSALIICLLLATGARAAERNVLARVTVYWRSEGCGLRASSNGARLHNGHCAVDPKKIAFGSKVIFPDATCIAVDTGPDVVNRKAARSAGHSAAQRAALVIDRYFETKQAALAWSRANPPFMTVRIADAHEQPGQPAGKSSITARRASPISLALFAAIP